MILCLDSGNSRLKWGIHDGQTWLADGALGHAELAALGDIVRSWLPRFVLLANVAGAAVATTIRQALDPLPVQEVRSEAACCGVVSGYENPLVLGVDRWHALIGARGFTTQACVVVMAGTATTIDTLQADGHFPGGLILPGLDLMRRALARDTAALPLACGQYTPYPRGTDDAIVSGCLEAQAGAIERAYARIADAPGALCLLSGGAAPVLAPLLAIPYRQVSNLVLEGLARRALLLPVE